eukprot:COSAG05_NODE_3800_length_1831_cov_32.714203_2_plen_124_part_00
MRRIAGVGGRQAGSRRRTLAQGVKWAGSVVQFSAVAVRRFVTPVRWFQARDLALNFARAASLRSVRLARSRLFVAHVRWKALRRLLALFQRVEITRAVGDRFTLVARCGAAVRGLDAIALARL